MTHENIKSELIRINEELNDLFQLIHADYSSESRYALSRYNMGIMVGIGYAQKELEKLVKVIASVENNNPEV